MANNESVHKNNGNTIYKLKSNPFNAEPINCSKVCICWITGPLAKRIHTDVARRAAKTGQKFQIQNNLFEIVKKNITIIEYYMFFIFGVTLVCSSVSCCYFWFSIFKKYL